MLKRLTKIIFLVLVIALVVMQFYPIDRSVPDYSEEGTLLSNVNVGSKEQIQLLKAACYDCHSYETQYPWYAKVAPMRLWVQNHIEEGRGHLNFSIWDTYSADKKAHKLEECIEEIEELHMPIKPYTSMHAEAKLSETDREKLVQFFKGIK